MRFNGEELSGSDPQKLMQGLNRPVIYYQPEDDLTQSVIKFLNDKYQPKAATPKAPAAGTARQPAKTSTR